MVSFTFVAALGALPLAFAQYYPTGGNATVSAATPTGTGSSTATQTVAVGQNGLTYTPDTVFAKPGDKIVFQFFPKNHTVTQADFNNPCNPSNGGIFSGFVPTASGPANQSFTITIQDEKPIWLYCSQNQPKPHCAAGMVAVINPPANSPNTLDAFRALAAKTNGSTAPSGGPSGGQVGPSNPSSPSSPNSPSGTGSGSPQGTGAASSLMVSSGVVGGAIAMFAGLML